MILSIHIPTGGHTKVKAGDSLDFNTPLYEISSTAEHIQPYVNKLEIEPSKIFHYLKKFVGEDVKKGEVIAVKKGLLSSKKITSGFDGKIREIDHTGGNIIISIKGKKDIMLSPVRAEVTEIKNKEIRIKIKDGKEFNLKNSSGDFGGQTIYLKNDSQPLSSSDISKKIVVSDSLSSYSQTKLEALGTVGYVTLSKLSDETSLPTAQLKTIQELQDIMKHACSYCYIDSKSSTIIFYR
jgi:hypothetical protein